MQSLAEEKEKVSSQVEVRAHVCTVRTCACM